MKINEIFYSLQGEGHFTGRPAIFIRFAGCNLRCPFCDTDFLTFTEMTEEEILATISRYPAHFVILTGGEPSLQLTPSFIAALKEAGYFITIETNGTHPLPTGIDWITLSPKSAFVKHAEVVLEYCNELKLVYNGKVNPKDFLSIKADEYYLQPCDTGNEMANAVILQSTIDYCKKHPLWSLSLQMHKIVGIK
jgi:organic radical activating enzyme